MKPHLQVKQQLLKYRMKEYKKNKEGFFVCEECGILYKGMNNFSRHIGIYHNKKINECVPDGMFNVYTV